MPTDLMLNFQLATLLLVSIRLFICSSIYLYIYLFFFIIYHLFIHLSIVVLYVYGFMITRMTSASMFKWIGLCRCRHKRGSAGVEDTPEVDTVVTNQTSTSVSPAHSVDISVVSSEEEAPLTWEETLSRGQALRLTPLRIT